MRKRVIDSFSDIDFALMLVCTRFRRVAKKLSFECYLCMNVWVMLLNKGVLMLYNKT